MAHQHPEHLPAPQTPALPTAAPTLCHCSPWGVETPVEPQPTAVTSWISEVTGCGPGRRPGVRGGHVEGHVGLCGGRMGGAVSGFLRLLSCAPGDPGKAPWLIRATVLSGHGNTAPHPRTEGPPSWRRAPV